MFLFLVLQYGEEQIKLGGLTVGAFFFFHRCGICFDCWIKSLTVMIILIYMSKKKKNYNTNQNDLDR